MAAGNRIIRLPALRRRVSGHARFAAGDGSRSAPACLRADSGQSALDGRNDERRGNPSETVMSARLRFPTAASQDCISHWRDGSAPGHDKARRCARAAPHAAVLGLCCNAGVRVVSTAIDAAFCANPVAANRRSACPQFTRSSLVGSLAESQRRARGDGRRVSLPPLMTIDKAADFSS